MRGLVGLIHLAAILVFNRLAVAFTIATLAPHISEIYAANDSTSAEIDLNELALRSIVYNKNSDEFDVLYNVENRALVTLDEMSPSSAKLLVRRVTR